MLTKHKFVLIGKFLVCFSEYLDFQYELSKLWGGFFFTIQSNEAALKLALKKVPCLRRLNSYDGWHFQSHYGITKISYTIKREDVFAFEYKESVKNLTILITNNDCKFFRLSQQFGLMIALHESCIGLHGVTLMCRNEVVILSAPSGTGKTTLGHLLEEYFDGMIINGDFALLSVSEDGVIFEPTPFCGTSRRALNHRVRVNRVVFLEQSTKNQWSVLDTRTAMIKFLANTFIPSWDKNMSSIIQENIAKCISFLKINSFAFVPEVKAAEMFFNHIE